MLITELTAAIALQTIWGCDSVPPAVAIAKINLGDALSGLPTSARKACGIATLKAQPLQELGVEVGL
ncbi:MAG: hypothetical protein V7L25_27000 [Nostoc sp.]|uniref:hypothetical protein n=1 Tax=Nostoc sp. TaxID=1180 RepID=UPI002FF385D1